MDFTMKMICDRRQAKKQKMKKQKCMRRIQSGELPPTTLLSHDYSVYFCCMA